MIATKQWRVEVYIGEQDGRTYAEARLHTELGDRLLGIGRAQVGPDDYDVPEIGDEVAVARAPDDPIEECRTVILSAGARMERACVRYADGVLEIVMPVSPPEGE